MGEFLDRPARLSLSLREREGNVGITPDNYQILPPSSNHIYTRDEEGWTDYTFIRSKIADCASDFAIRSKKPGKTLVAESTRDQRLAILSSFYQYADTRRKVPFSNPITMIERSPIEVYAGAIALSEEHVQAALAAIDRSTLLGSRNYALLLVLFNTGGRVG